MTILLRFALAIFIGIIVGIDRDSSWKDKKASPQISSRWSFMKPGMPAIGLGGVRTFTLISILGFICGTILSLNSSLWFISAIGFGAVVVVVAIAYTLNFFNRNTLGLTTELSMFTLFLLGFLLGSNLLDMKLVLAISVIISLILSLKFEVHKLISTFTKKEITDSLEFILITAVIYPWLPNVNVTLKQVFQLFNYSNAYFENIILFNPQQLWLVVIFVTSLSFIGYFLIKVFKNNKSILITGFLGGLVSSTTVTQLMATKSRNTEDKPTLNLLVSTALIANSTSFIRIPIIALVLNQNLSFIILVSMILMTLLGFGLSFFSIGKTKSEVDSSIIFKSPLAIKSTAFFAMLFVGVQLFTQLGLLLFGKTGFAISTLFASFSGLDAVTINTAKAIPAFVSLEFGALVLLGAVVANLIFKLLMTLFIGSPYFNKKLSFFFAIIIAFGTIGLVSVISFAGFIR